MVSYHLLHTPKCFPDAPRFCQMLPDASGCFSDSFPMLGLGPDASPRCLGWVQMLLPNASSLAAATSRIIPA